MATHSSILAWRIPWTDEPGGYIPWVRRRWTWLKWLGMNPNVNYGLLVVMVCQCGFIRCNKYIIWWGMLILGEAIGVGQEIYGIWEIFVPSIQFCCELKTTLKHKVYFLKPMKKKGVILIQPIFISSLDMPSTVKHIITSKMNRTHMVPALTKLTWMFIRFSQFYSK